MLQARKYSGILSRERGGSSHVAGSTGNSLQLSVWWYKTTTSAWPCHLSSPAFKLHLASVKAPITPEKVDIGGKKYL